MGTSNRNQDVSDLLSRIADLLTAQGAGEYRVGAYRRAAEQVSGLSDDISAIYEESGKAGLMRIRGVGESLANVIDEYLSSGRSRMLEKLEEAVSPENLFASIPGIGPELAHNVVEELSIRSLEDLEAAAHDGRLEKVDGFGEERVESVKLMLSARLTAGSSPELSPESSPESSASGGGESPSVKLLLELDEEYRSKAEKGELRTIAPKRFNPERKAWLPVMNRAKDGWEFTLLFSNTKRAHEQGKTHDWVVIYFDRGGDERQHTVVTETKGPLEGKRVVRGRERECKQYYGVD